MIDKDLKYAAQYVGDRLLVSAFGTVGDVSRMLREKWDEFMAMENPLEVKKQEAPKPYTLFPDSLEKFPLVDQWISYKYGKLLKWWWFDYENRLICLCVGDLKQIAKLYFKSDKGLPRVSQVLLLDEEGKVTKRLGGMPLPMQPREELLKFYDMELQNGEMLQYVLAKGLECVENGSAIFDVRDLEPEVPEKELKQRYGKREMKILAEALCHSSLPGDRFAEALVIGDFQIRVRL